MKRVLVTGASGFVGRHVVPLLVTGGWEVIASSRTVPASAHAGVEWATSDLLEPGAPARLIDRQRPSHLLHLAWDVTGSAYGHAPQNLDWAAASVSLVRAFYESGGQRAVVAGTCAEYGATSADCDETTTPLAATALYGAAKDSVCRLFAAYARSREPRLSWAWARLFYLYGADEAPARLFASVARSLLEGREAPTTAGTQIRDYAHIDDVAAGLVAVLGSNVDGTINVASGVGTRVRDLVESIGRATGRLELLRVGAIQAPNDEKPRVVASIRRLREEVGFTPDCDLDRGIRAAVAALRRDMRP